MPEGAAAPRAGTTDGGTPLAIALSESLTGLGDTVPDDQLIITIDGPAGTGKSTVARMLARRLGLGFLDTGAMYRAATAIFLDSKLDREQVGEFVSTVIGADLHFDWSKDPPVILAWDDPYDARIRDQDVTATVSWVATLGELRSHMVRKQRIIAAQQPRLVTEGRDQGSIAFPDAFVKFYLDAEPGIRARRRAEQLRADGHAVDESVMLERILERDRVDSTRSDGPLICPEDAIVVDTSGMTVEQVVDHLEAAVRERVSAAGRADLPS